MELLNIGRHCANVDCKQLDYLPLKCQYCQNYYCGEHSKPKQHSCPNQPFTEDGVRVPICPICNAPVPVSRGEDPNVRMDQHISSNCIPPPKTTSTKPYNSCSFGKCKNRVPVKLTCSGCGKNYCIKHRLGVDHSCEQVQRENKSQSTSKLDLLTSSAVTALSNSLSNLTTSTSSSGTPTTTSNSSASSKARNLNKKVKNSWIPRYYY